jgi:hypothetical protein
VGVATKTNQKGFQSFRIADVYMFMCVTSNRDPVSESGFLRLWNKSKIGMPEEFLKLVSKHGSAQYRRIIIGRSQQNWFAIRRLMESKNKS